jgi:hypothetical protein
VWCTIGLASNPKNVWMKNNIHFPCMHVQSHPNATEWCL